MNTVFLVGMPGSGKSTVAKKLAAKLQIEWVDTDQRITAIMGCDIPTIFQDKGESFFRKLEADVLRSLDYSVPSVISTGGGLPYYFDNMAFMNATGTTVYLKLPVAALLSRLMNQKGERPLLANLSVAEQEEKLKALFQVRESIYHQSKLHINGLSVNISELVQQLN